nr:hypothetical protein [Tanacetum cinerariifolium]
GAPAPPQSGPLVAFVAFSFAAFVFPPMTTRTKVLATLALGTLGLASFRAASDSERYFEIAKNLDIFATLFKEVNTYYVDEITPGKLVKTGIDGMLKSLDPYTNYIPEDDIEDFRTMTTGQY